MGSEKLGVCIEKVQLPENLKSLTAIFHVCMELDKQTGYVIFE